MTQPNDEVREIRKIINTAVMGFIHSNDHKHPLPITFIDKAVEEILSWHTRKIEEMRKEIELLMECHRAEGIELTKLQSDLAKANAELQRVRGETRNTTVPLQSDGNHALYNQKGESHVDKQESV